MKLIDISKLNPDKCYELSDDGNSLVEVDIISGEYCGRNGRPPIKAIDTNDLMAKIHSVISSTPISFSYSQANDYLHLEISRTINEYFEVISK